MILISHRRNSIDLLLDTPVEYGVEVDIRSSGEQLIIHHDPMSKGERFSEWIKHYQHGTLILNVKEEGLEDALINMMNQYRVVDFFFLDQSFPFLIKWAFLGERRCAVRVSEYESIETVLSLAGKVDWVWVDSFTSFPLSESEYQLLKSADFKLCLVSPELQGRNAETEIPELYDFLAKSGFKMDAVCSKRPDLWNKLNNAN